MKNFKIVIPAGYNIQDVNNDNLDVNIVLINNTVYFATLFTVSNIEKLMQKDHSSYFWSTDMIIIKDLNENTIKEAVSKIVNDEILENSFSKIGEIKDVYPEKINFEEINESI